MNIATEQWPKRHLITVDEYYRMAEVGLLRTDARVELIEGEIIDMAPIGSQHAGVVNALNAALSAALSGRAVIAVQQPLRLGPRSELQPDIAVLKWRDDFYRASHPQAQDVRLLIEVSDSTLRFDLDSKTALYARHAVPEYWVFDLQLAQLHCFREPVAETYRSIQVLSAGMLALLHFPDVSVNVVACNIE
jgi:Uma2 family endonuclease